MKKYIIDPEIGDETVYFNLRKAHESGIYFELLTEVGSYVTHDYKGREYYPRYADDRDIALDDEALEWLYKQDKDLEDYNAGWDDWACAVWMEYGSEMTKQAQKWLKENNYEEGTIEFYFSPEEMETKATDWLAAKAKIEQDMENDKED